MRSIAVVALSTTACGESPPAGPDAGLGPGDGSLVDAGIGSGAVHIGPATGLFASVAFHPTRADEVWASGDDGSGLYRSLDAGRTWSVVPGLPLDWSTYALRFDPSDPSRMWAPSYFGRGLVRSSDGGVTWTRAGTGLPVGPGQAGQVFDLAVRSDGGELLAATGSGVYRSIDGGATFAAVPGVPAQVMRAVAYAGGRAAAGGDDGLLYLSSDGASWAALPGSAGPISDLAGGGGGGLYIATVPGLVTHVDFAGGLAVLVDPTTAPGRRSTLWTRLAVAPGASRASDRVVVGTTTDQAGAPVGPHLHVSDDGGATWTAGGDSLDGASIFDVAIAPTDRSRLVLGTVSAGLFRSDDGGRTWSAGTGDLRATAALGLSVDATDPQHLLLSSVDAIDRNPGLYQTWTGGASWARIDSFPADVLALAMAPDQPDLVVVSTFASPAIHRSTSGAAGPWQPVAGTPSILRFRLGAGAAPWFAVARDGRLLVSRDRGQTWPAAPATAAGPLVADVATLGDGTHLACGFDLWHSTDGFLTGTAVRRPSLRDGEVITACSDDGTGGVVVATSDGRVLASAALAGASTAWAAATTPLVDAGARQLLVRDGAWILCGMRADREALPSTVSGLYRSRDRGQTWTALGELYPSRLCWWTEPLGDDALAVGLWGGGAWRVPL